ncbi:MAG: hypothetical protein WHU94_16705 [Thermogemmata sp.]|jgi:DNA/RNA endonuclease G (NUC1)|uniref:Uncharacterized protein n=1 Tax=Thermogemmata fonticola TaxID=2755323 RepID=A0A7V8VGN2_9BACT|nr:hypothetical protein [Thermogemmata fonticola]MBA2227700.1 hypothetical protein [Thermogemmata fonticola]MCX8138993.1 hypothetical protein [Gemmataceae bacterium]
MDAGFYEIDGQRIKIDKVVGIYQVWTMGRLPFATYKIYVVQAPEGHYIASPNVVVRNSETQCNEYVCGIGGSIEEAVRDAIHMFLNEVEKQANNKLNKELDEEDFVWMHN